ncbi:hypothetical protein J42TS3_16620 [Paenibacillus vini]|uniref:Lysozyme inhibitor LprI-like N-terminal domain-containing protein n=2 Tax=Paenibacillus vini TaxID=1476024 RepID=A0ABQ4M9I6_9BACL|nr:hypothetical protein J42TS3_16620 [Paenibacillus vini]
MMRKILILSLLACSILAGCGNGNSDKETESAPPSQNGQTNQNGVTKEPATSEDDQQKNGNQPSNEADQSTKSESLRSEYTKKLDEVEKGLADVEELNEEGTTVSMTQAADETYKRWDAALNEIYGELEDRLSEKDMAVLKQEQREWITERDETAEKEAAEYKGGTMEALQLLSAKARITKERCYELVELL